MAEPELVDALRAHLFEWLPRQGWFDAAEAELDEVEVVRTEVLARGWPLVVWVPLDVEIAGREIVVQTVIAMAPEVPDAVPDAAILGEMPSASGPVMAYDALADPVAAAAFVSAVVPSISAPVIGGVVDDAWRTTVEVGADEEVVLHRRLQVGPHPDVELPSAVAERVGASVRVPKEVWRRDAHDLAIARRRPRKAESAAVLARRSVDELLRRRCSPRENPSDVVTESTELGRALAALHVALADRFGVVPETAENTVRVLLGRLPRRLDDEAAALVEATYRRITVADDLGQCVRVHGNLDLSSVERARGSWSFTRFGGASESSLALDRVPISPLADLAGLIGGVGRCAAASVDAASAGAVEPGSAVPTDAGHRELAVLADAWEERTVDALIGGYTSNDDVHRLLPVERVSRDALLTLFELELRVRDLARRPRAPSMLRIPVEEVGAVAGATVRQRW